MSKNTTTALALCLITLFVLPANVMAGPFGLFKRCRTKPKCCPTSPCATVVASAAQMPEEPQKATTYECTAVFEGEYDNSEPCEFTATHSNDDCEQAIADAYDDVYDQAEAAGCHESWIEVECDPPCDEGERYTAKLNGSDCYYRVVYKICCCNGTLIERPFYHKNLSFAKRLAKRIACDRAAEQCDGRTRWCCWDIRRVPRPAPAPAQAPCCQ